MKGFTHNLLTYLFFTFNLLVRPIMIMFKSGSDEIQK